jgi:hypothetical protein
MRKRRWCFSGLTLALLAACVVVWKRSEPPYAFLAQGQLESVTVSTREGEDRATYNYSFEAPMTEMARLIERECGQDACAKDKQQVLDMQACHVAPRVHLQIMAWPGMPASAGCRLTFYRPATWLDRLRAFL